MVATTATIYTAPALTTTKITTIILTNEDTNARTATLYLVESGGTADEAHYLLNAAAIPTDGTPLVLSFDELYLNAADTLQAKASAANTVAIHVTSVELT